MRKTVALIASLVTALVPVGCASKDKPAPATPTIALDAGAADAADAGATAVGSVTPTDAGAAPTASATASAPPATPAEILDVAIDLAIKTSAATVAPAMAPEGAPGRATLAPNEHTGMVVTLQPNRCYTVVGYSPPGQVTALDVKLLAPPFYNVQAGASGANDKNAPVLGKGKAALCPVLPIAVPYKVDVVATKGAGRIGVQVFSRAK